ncbi:MAG TPA: UGSC family (seleno)protein, partial [Gammaproteobacteria bacterium]
AARIQALDGLRLGILDNTKWNANKLLRELRDQLKAAHPLADVRYYRKESFSKFAAPELLERIRRENDIVVTAIGD